MRFHPVALRNQMEMAQKFVRSGIGFVCVPVSSVDEYETVAASVKIKLDQMIAEAEKDE